LDADEMLVRSLAALVAAIAIAAIVSSLWQNSSPAKLPTLILPNVSYAVPRLTAHEVKECQRTWNAFTDGVSLHGIPRHRLDRFLEVAHHLAVVESHHQPARDLLRAFVRYLHACRSLGSSA
jgi:hypothetical protein